MYQLRELERSDVQTINSWRNDAELIAQLGAPFRFINQEVDSRWFDSYMANRNHCVRCAIVDENMPGEILGLVSLTDIDQLNQCAVLHIMIGSSTQQNKGIGSIAVKKMLEHAFMNLNMHRVELKVLASNSRAQHVYEKCGFVREGVLRKKVYKGGIFEDMYLYALLRENFLDAGKND